MRKHIAKSIAASSKALRKALDEYNKAAQLELGDDYEELKWEHILEMGALENFDLMRLAREDIRDKPWSKQEGREMLDRHYRLLRADEEIFRLNIEIKRFVTWMKEEKELYLLYFLY